MGFSFGWSPILYWNSFVTLFSIFSGKNQDQIIELLLEVPGLAISEVTILPEVPVEPEVLVAPVTVEVLVAPEVLVVPEVPIAPEVLLATEVPQLSVVLLVK